MILLTPFKVGNYLVIPLQHRLSYKEKADFTLQPKFIEVLSYLALRAPKVVTRSELIDAIWEGNQYVGEKALTNAVWNLRKVIDDDGTPKIETIRKTGYRLLITPNFTLAEGDSALNVPNIKSPLSWLNPSTAVLIFGMLMTIAILFPLFEPKPQSAIKLQSLTVSPGRELYPQVSLDQRFLLYTWIKINRSADLYIQDLLQPDLAPRQLTFTAESEAPAIWSKDGADIYFVRKSSSKNYCSVIMMNLATSQETTIGDCPTSMGISLALSSDGKKLAYTGLDIHQNSGIYFQDITDLSILPKRFSCEALCDYRDRNIAFSPDGKFVAVSRRAEELVEDIHLVNLEDGASKQLTFGEGDIKGLTWSADSKRIIYGSKNSAARSGYVVTVDNGEIERLNIDGFSSPQMLSGTNDMVFHQWLVSSDISYIQTDENRSMTPFPLIQSGFSHTSAHYSEFNEQLAYVSNESGYNEIWIASEDGASRKKVTNLQSNLFAPRWSHDGQSIAFMATLNKQHGRIYILTLDNLHIRELNTAFTVIYRPTWSLDDRSLIAAASGKKKSRLYRFPLNGDKPQLLADSLARYGIEGQDGNIWFTKGTNKGLWFISKPGMPEINVIDKSDFRYKYNWTTSNTGIYFHQSKAGEHLINFYAFKDQTIKAIAHLPSRTVSRLGAMTYIAKKHQLIFTKNQSPQADIKRISHPLLLN